MSKPSFELTLKIIEEDEPRTVSLKGNFPRDIADWRTIVKEFPNLLRAHGYIISEDLQYIFENITTDDAPELADKLDEILSERE